MNYSLLVLWLLALAQAAAVCKSSHDCSLLGECTAGGHCKCDAGWRGANCGEVDLLPADPFAGYRNASMSSWGGQAIKVGHKYHMFASAMVNNCTLHQFSTNSESIHASASMPGGPYRFEQSVLPPFHHSTTVVKDATGRFLVFAIGKDTKGKNVHSCRGNNSMSQASVVTPSVELSPHDYMSIATAPGLDGPWKERVIFVTNVSAGNVWNCNKSNPSPVVLANGSILLMYRGQYCQRIKGCRNATHNLCEHQGIAFAENADAPFVDRQGEIKELAGNEDAFFWQSKRGFHALFHSKNACGQDKTLSCGSLAHSPDSWHWTLNSNPSYNSSIQWKIANGNDSVVREDQLLSRQRPKIIFDDDGVTPLYLFNGALSSDAGDRQFTLAVPFNVPANRRVRRAEKAKSMYV